MLATVPAPVDDTWALLRRWQTYLEVAGRANENTRRQYRRYMIAFLAEVMTDPREITEDDILEVLARQSPQGGMRAQTLKTLHSFYRWAEIHGHARNVVRPFPIPRTKYGKAPTLELDELGALFAAAEQIDPRARPTLELLYATGARVGSLCALVASDLYRDRADRPWVQLRVTKGDRPYELPLSPLGEKAWKRLEHLSGYCPPRAVRRLTLVGVGPSTVWSWASRAGETAGLDVWPHLLRHSFATHLADVDDRTWAALMGHRDASLRRRYAAPRDDRMRAAVDRLAEPGALSARRRADDAHEDHGCGPAAGRVWC